MITAIEIERSGDTAMAVRGFGVKLTARILGMPLQTVKTTTRSAQEKLERVAVLTPGSLPQWS